eukprot:c16950_g1_i1.p1 GENE.c16950_g1_i1~~c16950_g1_i1.p1  ORF type:complete len:160 (-),score=28.72 c16950_g1_i1:123-602(-)
MVVYEDIVSGDPMCNDSSAKVVDHVLFEIMCNMIVVRTGDQSQDDDREMRVGARITIDAVETHGLMETAFDKKTFIKYIKTYMKRIREHLESTDPERAEIFVTYSMLVVKKILANFGEYQFFVGKSQNINAGVGIVFYKEDGITPYMWLFRDGLRPKQQ